MVPEGQMLPCFHHDRRRRSKWSFSRFEQIHITFINFQQCTKFYHGSIRSRVEAEDNHRAVAYLKEKMNISQRYLSKAADDTSCNGHLWQGDWQKPHLRSTFANLPRLSFISAPGKNPPPSGWRRRIGKRRQMYLDLCSSPSTQP